MKFLCNTKTQLDSKRKICIKINYVIKKIKGKEIIKHIKMII